MQEVADGGNRRRVPVGTGTAHIFFGVTVLTTAIVPWGCVPSFFLRKDKVLATSQTEAAALCRKRYAFRPRRRDQGRVVGLLAASLAAACLLAHAASAAGASEAPHETPASTLHKLLDAEWEWRLAQFPEDATMVGDHRYDDRVTDYSEGAVAGRREHHRALLAAVRAIDRLGLHGEDGLSLDILQLSAELSVREDEILMSQAKGGTAPWSSDDSPLRINQMEGPQFAWPQLVRATRFQSEGDYYHYLTRLKAFPQALRQIQAQLEAGRAAGWIPPKVALERLPKQFASLLELDLARNPLFNPFVNFPSDLAPGVRADLRQSGETALRQVVIPALQSFRDYLSDTWIPAARESLGADRLPRGGEYYALSLQRSTTTSMSAQEIHDLGLKEVARIEEQLRLVMQEAEFSGSLGEFRTFLRTDPRFQFKSANDELIAFRDIAKRVDPLLPNLFAELPRLPYGVRAMSPEEGNNAPHYIAGAIDGSRAGYFEANVNNLAVWPRWTMDAVFLHEAVPGHHLQIARAQEMPSIPKLRRTYWNAAYGEGWALYAEGLGKALGLYADPYSRFGRLSLEAHRAARLVVDTGLHVMGWSRERAIAYLIEHGQLEPDFAKAEVDRYLVLPGQATAYKVGELHILALRERARAALDMRFDVRRFHNALIDHGALPLTVLDRVIDEWIETERLRPAN